MVAQRYGWTFHYITTGISWINLRMMLADAIRVKTKPKEETITEGTDDDLRALEQKQNHGR